MSGEARRIYEDKTKAHQGVTGEIEALKRALTRNQRMLAGLDQRIAGADADTAAGLKQQDPGGAIFAEPGRDIQGVIWTVTFGHDAARQGVF